MSEMLSNEQLLSVHINRATEGIITVMDHFKKLEDWFNVSFDDYRNKAEELLLIELKFLLHPSWHQSKALDDAWNVWAKGLYYSIQDAALDFDFSPEKDVLDKYIQERHIARVTIAESVKPI